MSTNSTWIPNEDHQTLFTERCWLQGTIIGAIAYGINIPLYYLTFYLLIQDQNRANVKTRSPLLIYITLSFLVNTIFMITLAGFTQMAFIDNRNYPGGPSAFEIDMFSAPIDQVSSVAFVLSNWLDNGLVMWRFKVIYQRCRLPMWVIMLFPGLMFAGSVATGIMCLIQDSITNPYKSNSINFTLPYTLISLGMNIILTIAIVIRLVHFRNNIGSVIGRHHGTQYTSVAAMIIESSALYSATCITFIILFGIGNAASQVFLQSLNQIQTITSLLIVFRVAQGKGWAKGTASYIVGPGVSRTSEPIELGRTQFQVGSQAGASVTLARFPDSTKSNRQGEFQETLQVVKGCSSVSVLKIADH